jgi:hypothetical protein
MLKYRAEGFLLRDNFSDALMGLHTEAEALDVPAETRVELAVRAAPEPDPLLENVVDAEIVDSRGEESAAVADAPAPGGLAAPEASESPIDAPAQEPRQEAPSETPLPSTPAPVAEEAAPEPGEAEAIDASAPVEGSPEPPAPVAEEWNERGVCVGCGRHQSFIEHQRASKRVAHGTTKEGKPCPHGGTK